MTLIVPFVIVAACILRTIRIEEDRFTKFLLLAYPLIPLLINILFMLNVIPGIAPISTLFSLVVLYVNLVVRRELRYSEIRKDFAESRLRAMQMQVNPHFLFNTLSSIGSLCDSDPGTAKEMIYRLSDYMRGNVSVMQQPGMIPFEEELVHARRYLSIETMRFSELQIEYRIATTGFLIPNMTLQPLIENAIRHGIHKRRKGQGTIWIETEERKECWIVLIRDNGVGFDVSREPSEDMIGIRNVKERLRMLCGGTLEISSKIGEGTVCTITLPRKSQGGERLAHIK